MVPGDAPIVLRHPDRFFIGGDWVAPTSDDTFDVINPSNEEPFLKVSAARAADMERAVAAAKSAFDIGPWPRLTHAERAGYLRAIAAKLDDRREELARIWTSEMGIVHTIARQLSDAGGVFRTYADMAETFPFVERHHPGGGGAVGLLVREPVGVVAAIIPWNGPLHLMSIKIAPALIAGCTVIIKASPEAPGAAYVMAEIVEEVGLPPGVVNVICADRDVSEGLVRHPHIDKVTFTGSTAAGKRIASICGERIARYTLELGGKSPAIVCDDYDLGKVASSLAVSASFQTGQACSSLTRIIVSRKRHDELLEALSAAFSAVSIGDPFDPAIGMGPLAMERQRDRVENYIAKGKSEGATLATGGGRPKHLARGFFIEPTVFGNVANNSTIGREEIFGPVLSVIPAQTEDEAVKIANDTAFGLNASVFTNDAERAWRFARRLRSGTVGQNAWRSDFSIAFGGFKQSGVGREGGTEGLLPFLEAKTVILEGEPSSSPVAAE